MGTYGTFTGVVRWYDADTQTGYILSLRDGEVQASMVGDGITAANDNIALDANGMIVHDLTNASIITPVFGVGVTQDVLRSSEEFDAWEKHNTAAVTADTQISPMGVEQIADTVSLPAVDDYILRTSITSPKLQAGESGIFSVWLRAASAGTIQLRASRYAAGTTMATADVAVTTEWRRFSVTFSNSFGVEVRVNISIKRADSSQLTEVYAWGAQLTFGVARAVPYWPLQNAGNGLEAGMFVRGILGVGGYQNQLVVGSGWSTIPTGARTVAVGFATGHDSTGDDLVAIGSNGGHTSTGADVIAIGRLTTAGSYGNVILLGPYAEATAANQVVIGSSTVEYTDMYAGGGVAQSTPPAFTLHATGGSGTNIAGGALKLAGGQGTGSGAGGSVILQYAPAGGSGSSANALVDCLTISSTGVVMKPASDSTTALRMQNAAGSTTYLTVDSSGGWVSIGGTGIKMPVEGEIRSYSDVFWQGPRMTTSAGSEILRIVPSHRTVQIGADPLDRYSAYTLGVKPASNMPAFGVVAYASQSVDLVRFVDKNSQNAYQLTYDNIHNFLGNMNVGGRVSGALGFDRLQGAGLRYTTTFTSCASSSVSIFDGSHSTGAATKINAATSGVIEVSFNPYTGWTANTNTGFTYADGRLLITFFGTANCASTITVELYRPSGGVDGWTTVYTTTTNTASAVLVSTGTANYVKKIRITLSHASQAVWVEGISYFVTRPENIAEMQVIPRYVDEDIVLAADSVTWKDTAWTDRIKLAYNVANGASAVAYFLDTANALSTAGARLLSVRNNGTEQTYVDRYGGLTVNDTGADSDSRFEGDTDANLLFLDASTDRVGIGTATPGYKLDVAGGINVSSGNVYRVNGTQVVTARQAAIADTTNTADVGVQLNKVIAALRVHGLIAT